MSAPQGQGTESVLSMVVLPEQGLAHGRPAVLDRSGFPVPQSAPQYRSENQRVSGLKRKGLSLRSRSSHQGWSSRLGDAEEVEPDGQESVTQVDTKKQSGSAGRWPPAALWP